MLIIFKHDKLVKRVNEVFGNKEAFGEAMGLSKQRINSRLGGVTEFSQSEIEKAVQLLNIPPIEIPEYFFDVEVCRA